MTNQTALVKVQYYSSEKGASGRPYTYHTAEPLSVGQMVKVPVGEPPELKAAVVIEINVPDSEIAAFRDRVKTIPAGSTIQTVQITPEDVPPAASTPPIAPPGYKHVAFAYIGEGETPQEEPDPQDTVSTALEAIGKESTTLAEYLVGLFPKDVIENEADHEIAATALTRVRDYLRRSSAARTELVKPLNDTVSKINASVKERDNPVIQEDGRLKRIMGTFRARQQQLRQLEHEESLKKSAELFKEGSPIPEIVAPVPVEPKRVVQTGSGSSVNYTTIWKWEVTDLGKVPRKYFKLDEATVGKLVKAGEREIEGIRIYSEQVPTVRIGGN